jgi:alpha-L-rhamnosidase
VYTCAGSFNPEIWEPKTTYHGFRFVQISGLPASMLAKIGKKGSGVAIQARVVHSDIYYPTADPKRTSTADTPGSLTFKAGPGGSSHAAMLNQLQSNVQWTQRDNLFSVPTDCDQRNERQGWMADASLSSEEAINSFWMAPLYSNWLRMMSDVQSVAATEGDCDIHCPTFPNCTGTVTDTVPHVRSRVSFCMKTALPPYVHCNTLILFFSLSPLPHQVKGLYGKRPADPSWGFAYPLIYDNVRRYYGDDAPVVVELYDGLKAYVEWELRAADAMEAKNPTTNGLLTFHYYGDWLEPGRVPSQESVSQMSAAFNFIQSLRIQRDAAKALGRAKDYQKYLKLFASKAAAYQKHFFNTSRSTADGGPAYGPAGSEVQPTLVYPLWLGDAIADATLDAAVLAALMDDIVTAKRGHVATGIVASKWLMELLSERGASQLALDLLLQRSFPSWGYMISLNATTVWEHWEYMNGDGMNSHNHPAFAAVGAWMYRYIGGLRLGGSAHPAICGVPEERFAGGAFARSVFGPHVVDDARIAGVATKMTTIRGVMRSSWRAVYDADHTITALEMNWTLPSNVIGELRMPLWRHNNKTVSPSAITVTEGTRVVFKNGTFADAKVPGVVGGCVGHEASGDAVVVLRVAGGGAYRFTATTEAH